MNGLIGYQILIDIYNCNSFGDISLQKLITVDIIDNINGSYTDWIDESTSLRIKNECTYQHVFTNMNAKYLIWYLLYCNFVGLIVNQNN